MGNASTKVYRSDSACVLCCSCSLFAWGPALHQGQDKAPVLPAKTCDHHPPNSCDRPMPTRPAT